MNTFLRNLAEDSGGIDMLLLVTVIGSALDDVIRGEDLTQNIRPMNAGYRSLRKALLDHNSRGRAAAISKALTEVDRLQDARLETQSHIKRMTKLMTANRQALLELRQRVERVQG
jgi:hypothetical protein